MVYVFGKCDFRGGSENGFAEIVGCLSCWITLWVFCTVEYIQCQKVIVACIDL